MKGWKRKSKEDEDDGRQNLEGAEKRRKDDKMGGGRGCLTVSDGT